MVSVATAVPHVAPVPGVVRMALVVPVHGARPAVPAIRVTAVSAIRVTGVPCVILMPGVRGAPRTVAAVTPGIPVAGVSDVVAAAHMTAVIGIL